MRHRFFVATAGLLLGITLIGFSPSFFLKTVFEHPGVIARTAEDLGAPETGAHSASRFMWWLTASWRRPGCRCFSRKHC